MAWTTLTSYDATFPTGTPAVLGDKRKSGLVRAALIRFNGVVPTSPGTNGTVAVCKVPAGFMPAAVLMITEALGGTANFQVGDSGDTDRLMVATAVATATTTFGLAPAGFGYEYTSDTTINITYTGTPTAGTNVSGFLMGGITGA